MTKLTEEQAGRILKKLLNRDNRLYIQIIGSSSIPDMAIPDTEFYSNWHLKKDLETLGWSIYIMSEDGTKFPFLDQKYHHLNIYTRDKPTNVQLLKFLLDHKDQIIDKNYPETGILHASDSLEKLLIEDDLEK